MMKVDVIFSESLNSIIGPVQTLKRINRNRPFFHENGFDLTIFTNDNISNAKIGSADTNNRNYLIRRLKGVTRWLALHSFIYSAIRLPLYFRMPQKLIDYYLSLGREAGVLVFHSVFDCYCFMKTAKTWKAKIVLFIHADSANFKMLFKYFPKAKGTFMEHWLNVRANWVYDRIDRVVSISKIGKTNFENEFEQLKGKISLVVNGIDDLDDKQIEEVQEIKANKELESIRLICSGSINGRKGQWIIIDALTRLPRQNQSRFELHLLGVGPEKLELEERVKQKGLKNIYFEGYVENSQIYKYLASSDIYVLMSDNEGLPLSIIEALRCGLPVISTPVSGIPEVVINGFNGLLIERDVNALAKVLNTIDNYDWKSMAVNSRELFEKQYTFERMRKDYLEMLKAL